MPHGYPHPDTDRYSDTDTDGYEGVHAIENADSPRAVGHDAYQGIDGDENAHESVDRRWRVCQWDPGSAHTRAHSNGKAHPFD